LRDAELRGVRRRKHGLRLGLLAAVAVAAAGLSVGVVSTESIVEPSC
jgi:malonyl CoA-acyl carrier protein transacylase